MQCLLWEDDTGTVTAYIFAVKEEGVLFIQEYGVLKGEEEVFDQMVLHLCALLGREEYTLNFPAVIKASFPNENIIGQQPYMLRLITPFKVNEVSINTTNRLIEIINGDNGCGANSGFVFWRVDGF